jgi:hypothetical protein
MKLIVALIRPEKREAIQQALDEPGVGSHRPGSPSLLRRGAMWASRT